MSKQTICIVSPALAQANNGNWQTARRWAQLLRARYQADIASDWPAETAPDLLVALHARRSAAPLAHFCAAHPNRPTILVLTGTDLYRDIRSDADAQASLERATALVLLQPAGLSELPPHLRAKAHVIYQSAPALQPSARATAPRHHEIQMVGHLREEKDPLTLMRAVARLPADVPLRVVHIGAALDPALGQAAERTAAEHPCYRWLGGLAHATARRWIARSRALVHASRMEGGANVVIEAIRSRVPVLASRIDGNVGLLGRDYAGYFETGDDAALAALMRRFAAEPHFAAALREHVLRLEPRFAPEAERAAVRALLADLVDAGEEGG